MKFLTVSSARLASLVVLLLASAAAQAHTGHGSSGVLAGLVHPFGLDHLLAMVAVGVWSVSALPANQAWRGPAMFMLALAVSAALGAAGVSVPLLEHLIALSVVLFGLMLVFSRSQMPAAVGLSLVVLAASLHGVAHGAETPVTGFATYAAGFLLTTAALHFGGVLAGLGVRRWLASRANLAVSGFGVVFGAAGLYLFSQI